MTVPHLLSKSFLGHQDMVQGWLSFGAQTFSDRSVPMGLCVNCRADCLGIKVTFGMTIHFTVKFH